MRAFPVTAGLAALLLAPAVAGALGSALAWPLVLDRPGVASFLLCHGAHLSLRHLAFSGGATVLMAAALERRLGSARLAALLLGLAVVVSAAVLGFERGALADYQGASGIGYGLAAALAVRERRAVAVPVLLLLAGKVGFEVATGRCLVEVSLAAAGAVPVASAHLAGLAAGAALGASLQRAPEPAPATESWSFRETSRRRAFMSSVEGKAFS